VTLFSIFTFALILGLCFALPSALPVPHDAAWKGLKRFAVSALAIGIILGLANWTYFRISGDPVLGRIFSSNMIFTWVGTAILWTPLLTIRVIQIAVRERQSLEGEKT
jgi:hypothetical protein